MDLHRYGAPPHLPASRLYAGRYQASPAGHAGPNRVEAGPAPGEGPLASLPMTRAAPQTAVQAMGSEWSAEVRRCFADFNRQEPEPEAGDLHLSMLVRVLYLSPELHNLVSQAIRDISFAIALPAAAVLGRLQRGAELFISDGATDEIDACLGARATHFFVLRNLIARKLPPVAALVHGALLALGRPADAKRCADAVATAVREFGHADFSRAHADTALGAFRTLGREIEDNLRLLALALDDAQPPLDEVMAGTQPPDALGLWLIRMRADLVQFEAFDFYENADRPDRAAAMYERVVVRLRRKVEQCIRVIERLRPADGAQPGAVVHQQAWRDNLAEMRTTPGRERRKDCFRHAISLLGLALKTALEATPRLARKPASPGRIETPAAAHDTLDLTVEAMAATPTGPLPRPVPSLLQAAPHSPLPRLPRLPAPVSPEPPPARPAAIRRRASFNVPVDLQGTQKKISRLYESLQSPLPNPDTAEALKALLPHIDELSRGNRSLGLVFIRQLLLVLERQPDRALYDRAVFSAARNLETMPIDQHARRFFDSPLANVLALLRALQRAAPEQAGLFLETLDLCLSHRENLGLPERLGNEMAAMQQPYDSGLQALAPRFALAGLLHALAPHVTSEQGATLACRLAEALGHSLPSAALRSGQALINFACRLLLDAAHFHRAEVPGTGRLPAHRFLNLHDVGPLAFPLLQALPDDGRPLRVTVGGHGHQKGDDIPATRRAVLQWASDKGLTVEPKGAADLWVTRETGSRGGAVEA
jgi:hypothetical protein